MSIHISRRRPPRKPEDDDLLDDFDLDAEMREEDRRSAFRLVVVAVLSTVLGGILALQLRPQAGRYQLVSGSSTMFDTATGDLWSTRSQPDDGPRPWNLQVAP